MKTTEQPMDGYSKMTLTNPPRPQLQKTFAGDNMPPEPVLFPWQEKDGAYFFPTYAFLTLATCVAFNLKIAHVQFYTIQIHLPLTCSLCGRSQVC